MNLDAYIQQLSHEYAQPGAFLTESPRVFCIPFEDGTRIVVTALQPGFHLFCDVCEAPVGNESEFLYKAMVGNLFGRGTHNNVLGMDESGKRIVLSRYVDWELSYVEFCQVIEDFVNAVDFWKEEAVLPI